MNMKKLLRKVARTRKQKEQAECMSEADARRILSDIELSFEPLTDKQKQAIKKLSGE